MATYELDADELTDIRTDIGDANTPPVFSDDELQRLYTRKEGSYEATVVLAYDQLIGSAAKLFDYTQGQSSESRSQIIKQLKTVRDLWAARERSSRPKISIANIRRIPPKYKRTPR
jgi:hypothetical protein